MGREGAGRVPRGLEDSLFPSPTVFVWRTPWVAGSHSKNPRTAFPEIQRQRRLHRPRSLLRANQAQQGIVYFVGDREQLRRGTSPRARRSPRRASIPITRSWWPRSMATTCIQRHRADGRSHRFRQDYAAEVASAFAGAEAFQSASNTACIFLAIGVLAISTPTSRRLSSSSFRRL